LNKEEHVVAKCIAAAGCSCCVVAENGDGTKIPCVEKRFQIFHEHQTLDTRF
jgi:hypothetical protein